MEPNKKEFRDYIDGKIEGETMTTLSLAEIQKDFNLSIKDVHYLLAYLPHRLKIRHEDPVFIVVWREDNNEE